MKKSLLYVLVVLLFITVGSPAAEAAEGRLAKKIAANEKKLGNASGKERIDIEVELLRLHQFRSISKTMQLGNGLLEELKTLEYPEAKGMVMYYLGEIFDRKGDNKKVREYREQAYNIFKSIRSKRGKALELFIRAKLDRGKEYYDTAMANFQAAATLFDEIGEFSLSIEALGEIGGIYMERGRFKTSRSFFLEGMKKIDKIEWEIHTPIFQLAIAMSYHMTNQHEKSLLNMEEALKTAKEDGNTYYTGMVLIYTGSAYTSLNQPQKALGYLKQAREILENFEWLSGTCECLLNIGDTHYIVKNYTEALSYYKKAMAAAKGSDHKGILKSIYRSHGNAYYRLKDFEQSLSYYQKYWRLNEELFNEAKNRQLEEIRIKYESEQQSKQIALLEKENEIRRITTNSLVIGLILVIIILLLLFKRFLYLFAFWKKQKYVGQYRLLDSLGSGGMGTVYRAHRIRDKSDAAAVKVLRDELAEDEINRERFKREGTIIDKLSHPNIVRIYERGEYKGKLFLAMELVDGMSLAEKIKSHGAFDLETAIPVMKQITAALAFIHEKKIVHRDLKPANILLAHDPKTNETTVKLLDFGLAIVHSHSRLTKSGELVGTINYIAPEQIIEDLYVPAGDIYALGMIFYEILSGHVLYTGNSIATIMEKILDSESITTEQLPGSLPAELKTLIAAMLSKDNRPRPTAEDVLEALNINKEK